MEDWLLVSCVPIAGLNDVELKLIVADTGIGISAENQTQLFQEFTQEENLLSISAVPG